MLQSAYAGGVMEILGELQVTVHMDYKHQGHKHFSIVIEKPFSLKPGVKLLGRWFDAESHHLSEKFVQAITKPSSSKQVETQMKNQRRCHHGLWPEGNVGHQCQKGPGRLVHQM